MITKYNYIDNNTKVLKNGLFKFNSITAKGLKLLLLLSLLLVYSSSFPDNIASNENGANFNPAPT